jgi:hypothetical protein
MIVHSDTDEDETHRNVKPESEAQSSNHPGPMTRTRKARDAQLRLGIGRPTVAGGSGPRAATRSASSVAKGVRSRSVRGAKPTPAPIVEGLLDLFLPPCHLPFLDQSSVPCAGLYFCVPLMTRHLNCTQQELRKMYRNHLPATGPLNHGQ